MKALVTAMLVVTALLAYWGHQRSAPPPERPPTSSANPRPPTPEGQVAVAPADARLLHALAKLRQGAGPVASSETAVEPSTEMGRLYLNQPEKALAFLKAANEIKQKTAELAQSCVDKNAPLSTIEFTLRLGIVGQAATETMAVQVDSYAVSGGAPLAPAASRCLDSGLAALHPDGPVPDRDTITDAWPVTVGSAGP
jgi:hypothetical protein